MPRAPDLSIWYEALGSPYGIIVECSDPERMRQKLYEIRRKQVPPDAELESIAVMTSPTNPSKDLWLVRKGSNEKA